MFLGGEKQSEFANGVALLPPTGKKLQWYFQDFLFQYDFIPGKGLL